MRVCPLQNTPTQRHACETPSTSLRLPLSQLKSTFCLAVSSRRFYVGNFPRPIALLWLRARKLLRAHLPCPLQRHTKLPSLAALVVTSIVEDRHLFIFKLLPLKRYALRFALRVTTTFNSHTFAQHSVQPHEKTAAKSATEKYCGSSA